MTRRYVAVLGVTLAGGTEVWACETGPYDTATMALSHAMTLIGDKVGDLFDSGALRMSTRDAADRRVDHFHIERYDDQYMRQDVVWHLQGSVKLRCNNGWCDIPDRRRRPGGLSDGGFCYSCEYGARRSGETDIERAHRVLDWQQNLSLGSVTRAEAP